MWGNETFHVETLGKKKRMKLSQIPPQIAQFHCEHNIFPQLISQSMGGPRLRFSPFVSALNFYFDIYAFKPRGKVSIISQAIFF